MGGVWECADWGWGEGEVVKTCNWAYRLRKKRCEIVVVRARA